MICLADDVENMARIENKQQLTCLAFVIANNDYWKKSCDTDYFLESRGGWARRSSGKNGVFEAWIKKINNEKVKSDLVNFERSKQ